MNTKFLLFVLLLLVTSASAATFNAVPPAITINGTVGAGDPATVYVTGQTQAINVAWNAGTDHTYCEIYYTINKANQTELGRGHDGSKPVTFSIGSTFEFWMVVYPGNGQYSVVTSLNVVVKSSGLPPPSTGGTKSKTGTGGFDEKAKRKSDTVTDLRNAPFISDVVVQPDYRNVVISFVSTQSTPPLIEIAKVPPSRYASGLATFPSDTGAFSRFATAQKLRYVLDIDVQGEQLEVGTTYHYIINVFNNDRNATTRAREQIVGQFTTLSQTVVVVWEKVHVVDDGDELSAGECYFWFWANYGQPSQKKAELVSYYSFSGQSYYPKKGTVVIENAPDILKLHASGWEQDGDDWVDTKTVPHPPLSGAEDHSVQGTGEYNTNAAAQQFDLSNFPGKSRTVNFRLETRGGGLKFIAFGHFEIIRGTAERIGTTSSALNTEPDGPKAQGRVKPDGARAKKTLSICESARDARARNNPAAPGLTTSCSSLINELAAKGEGIASQDLAAVELRNQQPAGPTRRGFDIGMAAAEGQTAPGPGKDAIRDELSLAEQTGFNAAVSFSLARNGQAAQDRNAELAAKGSTIADQDPRAVLLRSQQPSARNGFDVGMAVAENQTALGPGKEKTCASLQLPAEQEACRVAVRFSVDRNRNEKFASIGAKIAEADAAVKAARDAETDAFFQLGFDIATGIFGDPALGAQGNTSTGPGSLGIRALLNPAGQRGFDASVKLHLKH